MVEERTAEEVRPTVVQRLADRRGGLAPAEREDDPVGAPPPEPPVPGLGSRGGPSGTRSAQWATEPKVRRSDDRRRRGRRKRPELGRRHGVAPSRAVDGCHDGRTSGDGSGRTWVWESDGRGAAGRLGARPPGWGGPAPPLASWNVVSLTTCRPARTSRLRPRRAPATEPRPCHRPRQQSWPDRRPVRRHLRR